MQPARERRTRHERESEQPIHLVIEPGTLYREFRGAVVLLVVLFAAYRLIGVLASVLVLFLLASILAAVLIPVASRLEQRGVPRFLTAIGLVVLVYGGLFLLGWMTLPAVVADVYGFLSRLNLSELRTRDYLEGLLGRYPLLADFLPPPAEMLRQLIPSPSQILSQATTLVQALFTLVVSAAILTVLVVHVTGRPVPLITGSLAPLNEEHRELAERALARTLDMLKYWALGTAFLCTLVGVLTGGGLWLIGYWTGHGFPYILLFAVIAAIGEIIPIIGPILSAIPPMLVALTIDPMLAVWVALLFLVIQQVENNVIVPVVMSKSVNVHPFSLIFALMVLQSLVGIIGAFLATPVALIVKICWEEFYLKCRDPDQEAVEQEAREIVQTVEG